MAREHSEPEEENPATEDVVARVSLDPHGAFSDLYRRVAPAVYTWATLHLRAPLRSIVDPEDVLQEVACRAYEGFDGYDAGQGDFRAWVFGIARNVLYQALDRRRSSGSFVPSPPTLCDLPDSATSVTSRVARDEQVAAFIQSLEELPEEDRRLLSYRGLEGLSHEEIAELMNLRVDAVMQRWSRLLARLRERGGVADFVAA